MSDIRTANGYVCKFETTDEGGGVTRWNFFIGGQPVLTRNASVTDTIRLAIETATRVTVTYDHDDANAIVQVQMVFRYVCESRQIKPCPGVPGQQTDYVCETHRYDACDPERVRICDDIQ
jgi:hypothetical protein